MTVLLLNKHGTDCLHTSVLLLRVFTLFRPEYTHFGYFPNSADSVQMPPNAASDQGLHCLLTEISMENAVKMKTFTKPLKRDMDSS